MSVIEQFGRRGVTAVAGKDPALPPMPRPVYQEAPHEKHAKAMLFVSDLSEDNVRLSNENGNLRQALELARMRIRDLEARDREREGTLEAYRRYSVEVKTHLQDIVDKAVRANEAALEVGDKIEPAPEPVAGATAEKVLDAIEKDITGATVA